MKRKTQRETNPFPYSDSNKRYHTFDYYMKKRFGGKCARIALDAGFSCPNIDGRAGVGGCIYCSSGSSGAQGSGSLLQQYNAGVCAVSSKWSVSRFVPYLQAHTNTYAPISVLREVYNTCADFEGAVMLAIATRADCLSREVVELLSEISHRIPLLVELGLQSVHDETAERINRGHSYAEFLKGYEMLEGAGGDIAICIHLINGLPGEDREMMMESAKRVSALRPHMVKLHLLHVLKNTPLEEEYLSGGYTPLEMEEYVSITAAQLELFSPETVIARVTGDAPEDCLVAPMWCRKKTLVTNEIDKELYRKDSYQGVNFEG